MEGCVATIGMFDGVHIGHQFVLRHVVKQAKELGLQSLCITFDHTIRNEKMLTSLNQKILLIRKNGIERVEVLAFTDALRNMTAQQFMAQVLKTQLNVKVLLIGYDNRFGHNREEGFDEYVGYGQQLGINVISLPPAPSEGKGKAISSSVIRQLIGAGKVEEAACGLGRPYSISGHVAHGEHIGTQLGFPTANIIPDENSQLIPSAGVYAVRVQLSTSSPYIKGMMNIGSRPTFGKHSQTLEVHLLHFQQDLYGQHLTIEFITRLREERTFATSEDLICQLKQDAILTEQQI